ncbi:molecular chaperone DnaJ, partial [Bacteroides ovatus]
VFKHPEGPAHKAMRRALGKARFGIIESRKYAGEIILGEDCFGSRGEVYFWPKEYSSAKMAQKRIDKLEEAGIKCEPTGYNGGYIRLLGYTPEMRNSLERERQEYAAAYQAWYSKQNLKTI